MLRLFSCLLLSLVAGCISYRDIVFHGRTENLAGDGWVEEGTRAVGSTSSTPGQETGRLFTLSLPPDGTFVLWHHTNQPGKTLHGHSSNGTLRAWLERYSDFKTFPADSSRKMVDLPEPIPLFGEMSLRWKSNRDFRLHVDLRTAGTNSAALAGTFEPSPKSDFEPNLIWVVPAMHMGLGGTVKARDPSEYTSQGTLASFDEQIRRLMKTRKRHRRVMVKNVDTGRAAEFVNRPTLLDKAGVQFDSFVRTDHEDLIGALRSFAQEYGLRFRTSPLSQDPSQSVVTIDIYGQPAAVSIIAASILQRAYDVQQATPLEFIQLD